MNPVKLHIPLSGCPIIFIIGTHVPLLIKDPLSFSGLLPHNDQSKTRHLPPVAMHLRVN